jgi:uncharacterized protein (TIRG00374 family)
VLVATLRRHLPRLSLLVAGTALGVVLLILLLRSVNLDQLGNSFENVDYRYLGLAVVPFIANILFKVPRWALLFGDDAPGFDTLFGAMTVGYATNSLLPARLGEVVRAYWVRDRAGVSLVRTLSTIALERVTDGVTLVIMLLLVAPTVAFPGKLLGPALTIGALFVALLLGMVVLAYGATRDEHPVARLLLWLEQSRWAVVGRMARQLVTGLQVLRSKRAVALLVIYTAVIWLTNALLIWLVLRAFHIEVPILAGMLLASVLNLGMAVPSSPGYVGVFDYLMVLTLGLYGVAHEPAVAAALAYHAIAFVPTTLIGLIYIARFGFHLTLQMMRGDAPSAGRPESGRAGL